LTQAASSPPTIGPTTGTDAQAFGTSQHDVRNDAVAEDDEDGGADEFCQVRVHVALEGYSSEDLSSRKRHVMPDLGGLEWA